MKFKQVLTAGVAVDILDAGDFLRVISAPAEDLSITFYRNGQAVAEAEDVGAGYSEEIVFDKASIKSAAGGLVRIVTRKGAKVGYDRAVGAVNISGVVSVKAEGGAFTQAQATVTSGTGALAAANLTRGYLMVQNKDAAGSIFITVDSTAATLAKGLRIGPGESQEYTGRVPTGAINGIGDIANNPNVVVVEG